MRSDRINRRANIIKQRLLINPPKNGKRACTLCKLFSMRFPIRIHRFNVPLNDLHTHTRHRCDEIVIVFSRRSAVKCRLLARCHLDLVGARASVRDDVVDVCACKFRMLVGMIFDLVSRVVELLYVFTVSSAKISRYKECRFRVIVIEDRDQLVGIGVLPRHIKCYGYFFLFAIDRIDWHKAFCRPRSDGGHHQRYRYRCCRDDQSRYPGEPLDLLFCISYCSHIVYLRNRLFSALLL